MMMRQRLILLIALTLAVGSLSATPYAGASFEVKLLSGYNYQISLHFYRNCNAVQAPNQVNIEFKNSLNPAFNFNATFQWIQYNSNMVKTCPSMPNACQGGNLEGFQEYIYSGMVMLPPGQWTISFSSCCRNPTNANPISSNDGFYVESKINNHLVLNNQIPVFQHAPKFVYYTNQDESINYAASDTDGDSLVYELIHPLKSASQGISPYLGGFTYLIPFASNPPPQLDGQTGLLTFHGTQPMSSVMAVKVSEYRNINGTTELLSSHIRDHEIYFVSGNNHAPVLGGMDTTSSGGYSVNDTVYSAIAMAGFPFHMKIWGFDADSSASSLPNEGTFSIEWDAAIGNASFTPQHQGTDSAFASFSWTPSLNDTAGIKTFKAVISDSACPYIGSNEFNYRFKVKPIGDVSLTPYVNSIITYIFCDYETLEIKAKPGYDRYTWSNGDSTQTIFMDSSDLAIGMNHISCLLEEDGFSYLAEIDVYMNNCTGLEEVEESIIQLYPNPAQNVLSIEFGKECRQATIMIVDFHGKVLISKVSENNHLHQIDISDLAKGVYFIKLQLGDEELTRKFIKH